MTIKLLVAIQGAGGVDIPANTEITLTDAVEAAHVSANKAVYTRTPERFDAAPSSGIGVKYDPVTGRNVFDGVYEEYAGFAANNVSIPGAVSAANIRQAYCRSYHPYVGSDGKIKSIKYPGFYMNGMTRTLCNSDITMQLAIEYPAGTYTRCTSDGNNIASRGADGYYTFDDIPVVINQGDSFWLRAWADSPSGQIPYIYEVAKEVNNFVGEGYNHTTTSMTNPIMGGTMTDASLGAIMFKPAMIIGNTHKPSLLIIDDSHGSGVKDEWSSADDGIGIFNRIFRTVAGVANWSRGGSLASTVTGGFADAAILSAAPYVTHCVAGHMINDIITGNWSSSALAIAGMQSYYNKMQALLPNARLIGMTPPPETVTTTDAYATVANQTAHARNPIRTGCCDWLRGKPAPLSSFIDVAVLVESSRNAGTWAAPGYTTDGTHTTRMANEIIARNVRPRDYLKF